MEIIFKNKYVNYTQISDDVTLSDINNVLLENKIFLELGDNFNNDWAGYSYYYCKSKNYLDEKAISSFVYIITWFMCSNPIDINSDFKSEKYFKNNKIINECLKIYNNIIDENISEIELCQKLFDEIYCFYLNNYKKYIKSTERINFVLTYQEKELFDKINGKTKSDKLRILLNYYF